MGLLLGGTSAAQAVTKFMSCEKMHVKYPKGISKSPSAASLAVQNGQLRPEVAPQVYADSYKTLDRDKDGSMREVDD